MQRFIRSLASRRLWFLYAGLVTVGLISALAVLSPVQVPVALYKLCLLMLSGIAGFCIDRSLFPYAEPSSYLADDWRHDPGSDKPDDADFPVVPEYRLLFAAAMARQAVLIAVSMLAVGLGL